MARWNSVVAPWPKALAESSNDSQQAALLDRLNSRPGRGISTSIAASRPTGSESSAAPLPTPISCTGLHSCPVRDGSSRTTPEPSVPQKPRLEGSGRHLHRRPGAMNTVYVAAMTRNRPGTRRSVFTQHRHCYRWLPGSRSRLSMRRTLHRSAVLQARERFSESTQQVARSGPIELDRLADLRLRGAVVGSVGAQMEEHPSIVGNDLVSRVDARAVARNHGGTSGN